MVAVEVDPVTWSVKILKYASANDAGTIINPKLVEGQTYGSALHGLGGALLEEFRWDEDGQFLTGTFADYRVPDRRRGAADRHRARRDAVAVHAGRREGLRRIVLRDARPRRSRTRSPTRCAHSAEAVTPAADTCAALGARPLVKPAPFEYFRPDTLDEALALLAEHEDAKPLAGGQSLVPMLNFRLARPSALVDLAGIDGLAGVRVEDGALSSAR